MANFTKRVAEVYKKYRKGDPISNAELQLAISELTHTVALLNELGERFHHAWWDLHQCLEQLKDFHAARKPSRFP